MSKTKTSYRKELYTQQAKKDRFHRVAERRINNLLNTLRLIGNTANTNLYSYTDDEVIKLFNTIEKRLIEIRGKFKQSKKKDNFSF